MMIRFAAAIALIAFFIPACASSGEPRLDDPNDIEVLGLLRTGVIAPAGDTTGIVVAAYDGLHYELVLDGPQLGLARQLDGQHVYVAGGLVVLPATDGDTRLVIHVKRLRHEPLK